MVEFALIATITTLQIPGGAVLLQHVASNLRVLSWKKLAINPKWTEAKGYLHKNYEILKVSIENDAPCLKASVEKN